MIDQFISKIAGFFEKDFLFASLLPALLVGTALAMLIGTILGIEPIWNWIASLSDLGKAGMAALVTLFLIVSAYILHALRPAFLQFWSGRSSFALTWGLFRLLERWQRRRYARLKARADRPDEWDDFGRWYDNEFAVALATAGQRRPICAVELASLQKKLDELYLGMEAADARTVLAALIAAYKMHDTASLEPAYERANPIVVESQSTGLLRNQTYASELDRRYGSIGTVRATELGNLLESQNQYPAKRYKMEAEIFLPRLRAVVPSAFLEVIHESRVLLDFALTMATMSTWSLGFALLVGPWLWYAPILWVVFAAVAIGSTVLFYRLAVSAATELGGVTRASYDLYRLDLLKQLNRPHPATFVEEQGYWEVMSQLVVYGHAPNFAIRPEKPG